MKKLLITLMMVLFAVPVFSHLLLGEDNSNRVPFMRLDENIGSETSNKSSLSKRFFNYWMESIKRSDIGHLSRKSFFPFLSRLKNSLLNGLECAFDNAGKVAIDTALYGGLFWGGFLVYERLAINLGIINEQSGFGVTSLGVGLAFSILTKFINHEDEPVI